MELKDIMVQDVVTLNQDESVKTLLEVLVKHKIGGVPVVDENQKLVGIVTDGDILRYLNPKLYLDEETVYFEELEDIIQPKSTQPIKNIMNARVVTLNEYHTLETALKLLGQHRVKKLPIIDDERHVVGIVSRGDLMKKLAEKTLEKL